MPAPRLLRSRPVLLVALLVVLAAAAVVSTSAWQTGMQPFGSTVSDEQGCRQSFVASGDPFAGSTGPVKIATDKTLVPFGVVCQESTTTARGLQLGPVRYVSDWVATIVFVLGAAVAVGSVVLALRLLLNGPPGRDIARR